ncbi:4-deoxy-L-threo-5-hexulose uronate isomerase [Rhizobium sp. PP-F2F-G38]|uniref:5-dehydro-4-deoxy-D-glucuronate isomerase n=1 Tax=Rhizobium sp. PP-CC-3G-465 TaxID=2135648 RepID=UPI000D8AFCFD|nr:4-deoxy-L-threo-5-hexulose uronate isomerase [Rhizobium sp. PP-WC-1G-195]PYE40581.1 4-deoxy-L-threo-5-hexulose uronate isomerase [Rhizobium sp. PP-F2F-G20b]PYE93556.1 4-deoxy-L-threo-5-hexulose uronate isomerase [Rhizobium sp. PP-F2F-G38]TCL88953.1 4-deoxy-L-threo-5-hexulose uronate isomerase [Rhizobium sp. PP-WC-2G-219]TCP80688.1 4-deoxy-L-threo-5-hexulose uronate isomerase [Rhizobium sp. PP-CC-2G-626]TCQ03505.1 4-deoxy-L-threo-5-hexulose uronate isomerase [Rhizobium sp. PP-F2F-G36]TCQ193
MTMNILYGAGPTDAKSYDTARLRAEFLMEDLFQPGKMQLTYTHVDRLIVGGAVPTGEQIAFGAGDEIGTPFLLSAREMGVANLGGSGTISVDGETFALDNRDVLYIGRGAREIVVSSRDPDAPARFYMNSVPAGADLPHRLIRAADSKLLALGDAKRSNVRQLRMYIHPEVSPSCLLLMGITDLAEGSVWNTMPPHLHERRMEAYCYFDLAPEDRVIHLMGRPEETRHLVVADLQALISPAWSIHMGAGTGPYAFVWGMTGENQEYNDVSPVALADLK